LKANRQKNKEMNSKLIKLYEEVKLKNFLFKDEPIEYSLVQIETLRARKLYTTRYEGNKTGLNQKRREEFKSLVEALHEFEAPSLLTHILGPAEKSIILFTDIDIDFLVGSLTSEYFSNL